MSARPILVGYDDSDHARAALRWALAEAHLNNVPVRLVFCFNWIGVSGWIAPTLSTWPDEQIRADAERMLADAAGSAAESHPAVPIHSAVLDGDAASRLVEESRGSSALVVGTHGDGGFGELLVGSTALAVAAHAHCPVVVVRGDARPPAPVVVGYDGSTESRAALSYALDHAAARDAPLRVVRAWVPPAPRFRPSDLDVDEINRATRGMLDDEIATVRDKYPAIAVTTAVVPEAPGRVLVAESADAQLVVVGSRGHGRLRGRLLGSVSQQLIHHSHCPVVVVREPTAGPRPEDAGREDREAR